MTALPPQALPELQSHPDVVRAYKTCLLIEDSLEKGKENNGKDLIYIRIMGYLILSLPTLQKMDGLDAVCREINSTTSISAVLEVGKMYLNDFIRAFRPNKGRSLPTSPNESSWRSSPISMANDILVEKPQTYNDARKNALIRDGYRCVVTGRYDILMVHRIAELRQRALSHDPTLLVDATRCTYIFPQPTDTIMQAGRDERINTTALWTVMKRFGYEELVDELNGPGINRLENTITVCALFRELFDNLNVWFVKTDQENTYKLEATHMLYKSLIRQLSPSDTVTFTTRDPVNLPVPSPTYLAIHATCAKVACLSGASKYIDKLAEEIDDLEVLDEAGGSSEALEYAISGIPKSV